MAYEKGDSVKFRDVYYDTETRLYVEKPRPAIIYDVIGPDHYLLAFYSTDKSDFRDGFIVTPEETPNLDHNSFLDLEMRKVPKRSILRLYGRVSDNFMEKIESEIDKIEGYERP